MYEIKILWSTGLERTLIVAEFGWRDELFFVRDKLATGESQNKYYPLNSIFEITIVSPKEEE